MDLIYGRLAAESQMFSAVTLKEKLD